MVKVVKKFQTIFHSFLLDENDCQLKPMQISPSNFNVLIRSLPYLEHINVKIIGRGIVKDMSMFQHLSNLRSLNLYVNRLEYNHHLFHRATNELPFKNPIVHPKMSQLKITGGFDSLLNRFACTKCVLYMALIYPNITRLELIINNNEGLTDQDMRLIFHHFTNLEVLGVGNCNQITDDAFTGTFIKREGHSSFKQRRAAFAISNLTRLHTLLLYPLTDVTNVTFVEGISKLPNLKRLALGGLTEISERGIEHLAEHCQKLEIIYFENCTQFDDRFVKFLLNRLIHLKLLRIGGCPKLTNELTNIEGLQLVDNRDQKVALWKAHNAYKIVKAQMPLDILDLEL